MMDYTKLKHAAASAALVVGFLGASAASAATVDFLGGVVKGTTNGTQDYNASLLRATLECDLCLGLNSSAVSATNVSNPYKAPATSTATGFVSGYSDLFYLANNSEALERGFVNSVATPLSFATNSGSLTDGGGLENFSFVSSAKYILFAIGKSPDVTIIQNTGYLNKFTFAGVSGLGSGLSHYVEFGENECTVDCDGDVGGPSPVPLPAGLPLLASALGFALFLRKRRT